MVIAAKAAGAVNAGVRIQTPPPTGKRPNKEHGNAPKHDTNTSGESRQAYGIWRHAHQAVT